MLFIVASTRGCWLGARGGENDNGSTVVHFAGGRAGLQPGDTERTAKWASAQEMFRRRIEGETGVGGTESVVRGIQYISGLHRISAYVLGMLHIVIAILHPMFIETGLPHVRLEAKFSLRPEGESALQELHALLQLVLGRGSEERVKMVVHDDELCTNIRPCLLLSRSTRTNSSASPSRRKMGALAAVREETKNVRISCGASLVMRTQG